jgi:hypothetical protein
VRIGLVGCGGQKLAAPAAAKDLYTSTLFKKKRAYVERYCDGWWVISAKHGLLDPEQVIQSYDLSLASLTPTDRYRWAFRVAEQVDLQLERGTTIEIHAGNDYALNLSSALHARGFIVLRPLCRVPIGLQLQWYTQQLAKAEEAA